MLPDTEKKSILFKYEGQEFLLRELPAGKLLASVKALAEGDTKKFFNILNLPEDIRLIVSLETPFKCLLNAFLSIHKEDSPEEKGEGKEKDFESIYKTCIQIIKVFCSVYPIDPTRAMRVYTLRQICLWLRESKEDEGKSQVQKNIPPDAKNYREWVDGAGNPCRSWEVRVN